MAKSGNCGGALQELRLLREVLPQAGAGDRHKRQLQGYEYVVPVRPEDCIGCAICGRMCPDGAIEIYK